MKGCKTNGGYVSWLVNQEEDGIAVFPVLSSQQERYYMGERRSRRV